MMRKAQSNYVPGRQRMECRNGSSRYCRTTLTAKRRTSYTYRTVEVAGETHAVMMREYCSRHDSPTQIGVRRSSRPGQWWGSAVQARRLTMQGALTSMRPWLEWDRIRPKFAQPEYRTVRGTRITVLNGIKFHAAGARPGLNQSLRDPVSGAGP
jgi:hypothetical protein